MKPPFCRPLAMLWWAIGLLPMLLPDLTLANGGVFDTSVVRATGQLVPQRKDRIRLEEETLHVTFALEDPEFADVAVEYFLVNHGGEERVTYGFPVDTFRGAVQDRDLTGYRIREYHDANSEEPLAVTKVIRESGDGERRPATREDNVTEGAYLPPVRQWFMSEIAFAKNARKTLCVDYRAKSRGTTSGTSKNFLWDQSPRTFRYTFQPAQTWGEGRIGKLHVAVDIRALRAVGAKIQRVEPGGSVEREGVLHWEFTDLDLKSASDLVITYDDSAALLHTELAERRLPREGIRAVVASSTHPPAPVSRTTYGVANLLDGRPETAWVAGTKGPAVGEWIELRFAPGTFIRAVGILNGYTKDADLFAANGRIKKLRVEKVTAAGERTHEEGGLVERPFTDFDRERPEAAYDWVLDQGDSSEELSRVRLTILEAEPGTKFADTAVSEIFVCGRRDSPRPAVSKKSR